tara:strand:- start:1053 stop:2153 length:1101 start_codon:yes stop_codon:yes gene_type:complete
VSNTGVTPLYAACDKGHVQVVQLLLEKDVKVNQADKDGATPLFAACEKRHFDIVRLLLDNGVQVDQGAIPLLSVLDLQRGGKLQKTLDPTFPELVERSEARALDLLQTDVKLTNKENASQKPKKKKKKNRNVSYKNTTNISQGESEIKKVNSILLLNNNPTTKDMTNFRLSNRNMIVETSTKNTTSTKVRYILQKVGLEQKVGPIFFKNEIFDDALSLLQIQDLVEVGITKKDAKKIIDAIHDDEFNEEFKEELMEESKDESNKESNKEFTLKFKVESKKETKSDKNIDNEPKDEFMCPLTLEIMNDPVVASDGYTYERSVIEDWFRKGNNTSPITNETLEFKTLFSNKTLRILINEYNENKLKTN